jgi:intracellular septation protein
MKLAVKLMIEFAPLAIFLAVSTHYAPRTSTAVFMAATVVSVVLMRRLYDQVAMMALITAATGIIAGTFTVILDDQSYIQMKPTIVSLVFAAILAGGLALDMPLFQKLLGQELHISNKGWSVITWLWLGYFIFIALLNEYLRREYSWDTWIWFKALGLMPITVAFALPQMLLLRRYRLTEAASLPIAEPATGVGLSEAVEMLADADGVPHRPPRGRSMARPVAHDRQSGV